MPNTTDARREAARLLGSTRSPAKLDAARKGAKESARRRTRSLADLGCTCPTESTASADHPKGCPARRTLYLREKKRAGRRAGK